MTDRMKQFCRWLLCVGVAFCGTSVSFSYGQISDKVDVLVIDPGHGGKDAGCVGKTAREKDVALAVAKKFGALVKEKYPDVTVVYTRSDDRFIELWKRGQIANDNHADLFVSIHCNAAKSPSARGVETWIRGSQKNDANLMEVQRENAVVLQEQNHEQNYSQSWMDVVSATVQQDAGFENSVYFSQELQKAYGGNIPSSPNRGIKQGPFYVLWKSARPSVLTEIGFLSNPEEEKFLSSEKGQLIVAQSLLTAFGKYKQRIDSRLGSAKSTPEEEFLPSPHQVLSQTSQPAAPQKPMEQPARQEPKQEVPASASAPTPTSAQEQAQAQAPQAPQASQAPVITYKVQIAASGNKLELKAYNFKGLNDLSLSYDTARKLYKYYYGNTSSYEQVQKLVEEAKRAGYENAFVTAFENDVNIPVQEALGKQEVSGK
ncbi:MAG: N-acetylmuramoyl-L-alanine amidase [Bacteroidales bacterium]|nr:N-acetylmuramoyl-L-alanine amidase [Bacteroidales bacterium]